MQVEDVMWGVGIQKCKERERAADLAHGIRSPYR